MNKPGSNIHNFNPKELKAAKSMKVKKQPKKEEIKQQVITEYTLESDRGVSMLKDSRTLLGEDGPSTRENKVITSK